MSYNAKGGLVSRSLELLQISLSGAPAVNGYYTFDTEIESNFSNSISGVGGDTLTLPTGYYWAQAVIAITRTSASQNYEFQFEVGGNVVGKTGRSGWHDDVRSDYADAMFENTSSTISLKLKCIDIETSAPTIVSGSSFYIWRVAP